MEINSKNLHAPKTKKVFSANVTRGSVTHLIFSSAEHTVGRRNQRILSMRYNTRVSKIKLYGAKK